MDEEGDTPEEEKPEEEVADENETAPEQATPEEEEVADEHETSSEEETPKEETVADETASEEDEDEAFEEKMDMLIHNAASEQDTPDGETPISTKELFKVGNVVSGEPVGGGLSINKIMLETYKDNRTVAVISFKKSDNKIVSYRIDNPKSIVTMDDMDEYLNSLEERNEANAKAKLPEYETTSEGLQKFISDNEGMIKFFVDSLANSDEFESYAKEIIKRRKKSSSSSRSSK